MSEEKKESVADAIGDAGAFLLPILLFVFIGVLAYQGLKQRAEEFAKDISEHTYEIRGVITKVETWKLDADPVVEKQGRMTITLVGLRDKTKITFDDGRTKEFHGMPKETVPTGQPVVITYAKYDLLKDIKVEKKDIKVEKKDIKVEKKDASDLQDR